MRFTTTTSDVPKLPYSSFRINGCSNSNIEFFLIENLPVTKERRYCNKILVHECISAPFSAPLTLDKAEFLATSDPCYNTFEIFKSSEEVNGQPTSIELIFDETGDTTSVLVQFTDIETCCVPLSMTYKLYGYVGDEKILLSIGRLYVTPCSCCGKCGDDYWVDVGW